MALGPDYIKIAAILGRYVFNSTLIDNASPGSHIIKDLKINSARIVDIVLDLEDEYSIEIDNKALAKIQTVKDVLDLITSLENREG